MRKIFISIILLLAAGILFMVMSADYKVVYPERWNDEPLSDLLAKGLRLAEEGRTDSALIIYSFLASQYDIERQSVENKRISLEAMGRAGYIYHSSYADNIRAYSLVKRSLDESRRHGFKDNMSYDYMTLAIIYRTEDRIDRRSQYTDTVFDFLRKAYRLCLETGNQKHAAYCARNMAVIAYSAHSIGSVRKELHHYLKSGQSDNKDGSSTRSLASGILDMSDGRYKKAIDRFGELRKYPDSGNMIDYHANVSECYYRMGDLSRAITHMDSLKTIFEKNRSFENLMQAYRMLWEYYDRCGNETEALSNKIGAAA